MVSFLFEVALGQLVMLTEIDLIRPVEDNLKQTKQQRTTRIFSEIDPQEPVESTPR